MTGPRARPAATSHGARQAPAHDGGASRIVVVAVAGVAALMLVSALTVPMMIAGGTGMLFSAGSGCSSAPGQASPALQSKPSGTARNAIPANYLSLYKKFGQQYGVPWVILAGIGTVESGNGRSSAPGVHSGTNFAGAAGPMQIGVGGASGNQWGGAPVHPAGQKVNGIAADGDGDGVASVYDPADAIAGAARYLVQAGVQTSPAAAIFSYNHSPTYVSSVQGAAASFASGGFSVIAAAGGTAGGAAGGTASAAPCVQTAGTVINGSTSAPNAAVSAAISYAEQQIGKPYLWGGTGPDSFDCSGLIMMAYRSVGAVIPRTSQAQWAWGPRVQPGHEKPGDLVFFAGSDGTAAAPGHVGLVIGGGKMIEAYATGYPIRIASYGTASSSPGDQHPTGFTRPWAHAGVALSGAQAAG